MSGGKLVHESLIECGVDTVFGYSGGANLPVPLTSAQKYAS